MRRRLSALVGPRPKGQDPAPHPEPPPRSQQPTLTQIFQPEPVPDQAPAPESEEREVPSRKSMPFPFLVSQKDPDSVRPPFKSITRRKNPKPQPDEASQIRSGNTIRFTPDVQHQPPVQPEPEPTPELTPEATPSTTAEPIRRQLQNTIVEINPSFIPPNAEAPPSHPKPSIADIIRASKKRITIAVLAGVALGMAGNVAYYYHSTGKNPNQNIDKAFE